MKKGFSLICCLAVLLGIASSAGAAVTISSNINDWQEKVDNTYTSENFNGPILYLPYLGNSDFCVTSSIFPGVRAYDEAWNINDAHFLDSVSKHDTTTFTFKKDMYGFGGTWTTDIKEISDYLIDESFGKGISVTAYFNDTLVDTFTDAISNNIHSPGQFWGFTSTTAFNRVVLSAGNQGEAGVFTETFNLDNLVYSSNPVSQTPVPAAAWIFITGLAGMLSLRRKNRK